VGCRLGLLRFVRSLSRSPLSYGWHWLPVCCYAAY
jgi:hypothetical protein